MKYATTDTGMDLGKLIGAVAAGALLMYALDPERGRARRARAMGALRDAGAHTGDALGSAWHGAGARLGVARDRAAAAYARADAMATQAGDRLAGIASDMRDRMGHAAHDTRERMADSAYETRERMDEAAREARTRAWDSARSTRSYLDEAGDGARSRARYAATQARDWLDQLVHAFDNRSPTLTNSALLGGGVLGVAGLLRRSPLGLVAGLAALALLTKSGGARRLAELVGGRGAGAGAVGGGRWIDVEKSIHIDASPDDVYDAWSRYDNFPRFMSHVSEVRDLGHRRSHWVVKGPGGLDYSWNAVMTEQSRPERMAWRSEPGSDIEQEGSVSFEPVRGGTRVTVRMAYLPPAGALGHGIARMLGADPKRQMDDDLARMKSFVERGVTPYTSYHSPASDRTLH